MAGTDMEEKLDTRRRETGVRKPLEVTTRTIGRCLVIYIIQQ